MEVPDRLPADLRRDRRARRARRSWCSTPTTTCSPRRPSRAGRRDPWTPTRKDDGRIYGRGAADDNGGLVAHLGHAAGLRRQAALHRQADPRGDGGDGEQPRGVRRGPPRAVRRATCSSSATWATSESASPSSRPPCAATSPASSRCAPSSTPCTPGVFGGPAPDAMMALARLLATLHDDDGQRGRRRVSRPAPGPARDFSEEDLRASADVLDGVDAHRHRHGRRPAVGPSRRSTPSAST